MTHTKFNHARLGLLGFALTTLLASTGCELLFWTSFAPDNYPCRVPNADNPYPCVEGYTCVDDVCIRKAVLAEGDSCRADDECEDGLICRNHYGDDVCEDFDHDLNCTVARGPNSTLDDGRKCRRECNPLFLPADQCAPGNTCYDDEEKTSTEGGYCQPGLCSNNAQCGNNAVCVGENDNPDPSADLGSGRCWRTCDPFTCNASAGCNGCPTEDTNGDSVEEVMGCEPVEFLNQTVCVPAGTVPYRAVCSATDTCQAGSFCPTDIGRCTPYCNFPTGTPACNTANGEQCSQIDGNLGYCQL